MPNYTTAVIIPAYNAASTLKRCLDSVTNQSKKPKEIWVVDDGSTDTTTTIAESYSQITLLKQSHKGPAEARNRAAKKSTADILVFLDADMTLDADCLEKLIAPIEVGNAKGTFTKEEHVANWDNRWARAWNWEYTHSGGRSRLPEKYPNTAPVFRAILKEEFDKVDGFTSGGYNDDWSLSEKLGYESVASPGAIIYHANPGSLKSVWKQAMWISKRKYKLGELGRLVALVRALPPISLVTAIIGTIQSRQAWYLPFKGIYDLAIVTGIISYWMTNRHEK